AAAGLLGGRARGAQVVDVVRVFDETVVDVVAHLLARRADEVDALDRLVDALAVEDAPLQLLDADAEQLLVLALDLPAAGLVLRKIFLPVVGVRLLVLEDAERLALGAAAALLALPRACHPPALRQRVRCV